MACLGENREEHKGFRLGDLSDRDLLEIQREWIGNIKWFLKMQN